MDLNPSKIATLIPAWFVNRTATSPLKVSPQTPVLTLRSRGKTVADEIACNSQFAALEFIHLNSETETFLLLQASLGRTQVRCYVDATDPELWAAMNIWHAQGTIPIALEIDSKTYSTVGLVALPEYVPQLEHYVEHPIKLRPDTETAWHSLIDMTEIDSTDTDADGHDGVRPGHPMVVEFVILTSKYVQYLRERGGQEMFR